MNDKPNAGEFGQEPVIERVPVVLMQVNRDAQRDMNWARVGKIAGDFHPDALGNPTVNHRDGHYNIVDGQHRVAALKQHLGDEAWQDAHLECRVYKDLSDEQEAQLFLRLNDRLRVGGFDEFKVAVRAGRPVETEVARLVGDAGLVISRSGDGITATGTLVRVYNRAGAEVLARVLLIIKHAYGEAGFDSVVIDGIGLFCHRYGTEARDEVVIERLANAAGGANGLLNKANQLRLTTGSHKSQCVAAAVVNTVNKGPGKRLPSWWRTGADGER